LPSRLYTENLDLRGVWTGLPIHRSLLAKEDEALSLRLADDGGSGSGMLGGSVGLAFRLSILLCMGELGAGLSTRGTGSAKGLADAVRISAGGGGMIGMMEALGL